MDIIKVTGKRTERCGDGTVILLPGILARPVEQYNPLGLALEAIGRPIGFSYASDARMNMPGLVELVRTQLSESLARGPVVLVGSSMGGMQIPFIIEDYRNKYTSAAKDLEQLKIIIVDAPTGAETMKALPNFAAGLLASGAGRMVLGSSLGDKLVAKMSEPPKDDEITIPSDDVMRRLTGGKLFSDADYKAWVKATAIEGLKGYSGLLWWSQMRWMINAGKSHQLDEAIASLHELDVTYLACTHPGNGVVAQPSAMDWWAARLPTMKRAEVYGTHCGYLQNQPEFAAAFRAILE